VILAASDGSLSGMFAAIFAATVPVPIVVILFLGALALLAVKK
jgi:hypothetical protein